MCTRSTAAAMIGRGTDEERPVVELDPSHHHLLFVLKRGQSARTVLRIRNVTEDLVAFKVKTTAPGRYYVQPNKAFLAGGCMRRVHVVMASGSVDELIEARGSEGGCREGDENLQATLDVEDCADKFLVEVVKAPPSLTARQQVMDTEAEIAEMDSLFGTARRDGRVKHKLLVQLRFSHSLEDTEGTAEASGDAEDDEGVNQVSELSDTHWLELDPPETLPFHLARGTSATSKLYVRNVTSMCVAFKVSTTAPEHFYVRPNQAILPPESTTRLKVGMLQSAVEEYLTDSDGGRRTGSGTDNWLTNADRLKFLLTAIRMPQETADRLRNLDPSTMSSTLSNTIKGTQKRAQMRYKVTAQLLVLVGAGQQDEGS